MKAFLLVGIGGFLGSVSRYSIGLLLGNVKVLGISFPATIVANITGCLLIGILLGYSDRLSKSQLQLGATGFCGGFTTFSTFSAENMQYMERGEYGNALLYIGLSIGIGLLFTCFGYWLAKQF